MSIKKSNYLIFFWLALVFTSPGLFAYLYYRNPQWLAVATTNKGELLKPPLLLWSELPKDKKKWDLLYWYPDHCRLDCLQTMDRLARIRLALGRKLYQVNVWLVLPKDKQIEIGHKMINENDIQVLQLSTASIKAMPILKSKPKLFIANPDGYLILAYEDKAPPKDLYHDMKQLLVS